MSCEHARRSSRIERRWHLLRCPECRAARNADAGLARGIARLRAEVASAPGLARTLAAVGVAPVARAPRSSRWKARLRHGLMPAGAATVLLAGGWFYYIEINPTMTIPTHTMPSHNAFDVFRQAHAAEQDSKTLEAIQANKPLVVGRETLFSTPSGQRVKPGDPAFKAVQLAQVNSAVSRAYTLDEIAQVIGKNHQVFTLLRQGLQLPYMQPPVRSPSVAMPYITEDRELARVLNVEARAREARGDRMGAVNSRLDAMQLGAMIPRGSTIIGKLIGIACEAIGRDRLWKQVDTLNAVEARTATRRMEQIARLHIPIADALQEEAWSMEAGLMEIFRDRRWRITFLQQFVGEGNVPQHSFWWNPEGIVAFTRTLPYSKRRIMHDFTTVWDQVVQDARLPYSARKLSTDSGMQQMIARNADPLLDVFFPVFAQAGFKEIANCEVQDNLLMTMFALRAYQQEHHAYPQSLAALVPDYLAAVPQDPFAISQPLCYRRVGAKYVLYSVGPDGNDDGGVPIDNFLNMKRAYGVRPPGSILRIKKVAVMSQEEKRLRYNVQPDSRGDIVAGVNTQGNGN